MGLGRFGIVGNCGTVVGVGILGMAGICNSRRPSTPTSILLQPDINTTNNVLITIHFPLIAIANQIDLIDKQLLLKVQRER